MTDEILDIVTEKDEVTGNASYQKIHSDRLMHHVAIAMVINSSGKVLLQLRAKTKSAHPLNWSFSMGGHVRHGETYTSGLKREAKEEIGVNFSENDFLLKGEGILTEQSGAKVFYKAFEVMYDGPVEEKTEEVDAIRFVSWEELCRMILDGKEKMHPQMVEALKRHWGSELGL